MYGFGHGTFAEYIAVHQGSLEPKPANLTFGQAATVPLAAVTALQGLRAAGIQPGQRVLIVGAPGGVGTFAVQIATHRGAQVTGVCSTRNVDVVRRLGAGHLIDYTKQDFTLGAARYDLVLQLGGTYSPAAVRKALTPRGTLIQSFGDGGRWFGPVGNILKAVALNARAGQTLKPFTAKVTAHALQEVGDLIESGRITPVIDRAYPSPMQPPPWHSLGREALRARSSSRLNHPRRAWHPTPHRIPHPRTDLLPVPILAAAALAPRVLPGGQVTWSASPQAQLTARCGVATTRCG